MIEVILDDGSARRQEVGVKPAPLRSVADGNFGAPQNAVAIAITRSTARTGFAAVTLVLGEKAKRVGLANVVKRWCEIVVLVRVEEFVGVERGIGDERSANPGRDRLHRHRVESGVHDRCGRAPGEISGTVIG